MSLTSKSVVITLKAIEMSHLREVLEGYLQGRNYNTQLESMNDSELLLKINQGRNKTLASLIRYRHRPLEVVIDVDYSQAEIPMQVNRDKKSNRNSTSSISPYRWIWLVVIFGGFIFSFLSSITTSLSNFIEDLGVSEAQLIGIAIIIFLALPLLVVYGKPGLDKWINQNRSVYDALVLEAIQTCLEELQLELTATEVLRCWSCFKEIDFGDRVCAFCGQIQKA